MVCINTLVLANFNTLIVLYTLLKHKEFSKTPIEQINKLDNNVYI